jgi:hypothetical protein
MFAGVNKWPLVVFIQKFGQVQQPSILQMEVIGRELPEAFEVKAAVGEQAFEFEVLPER